MSAVLTVRELTEHLRRKIEGSFPFVWVRGEVSNLSRPSSGHVYFALKDADALLNCVWFRGQQRDAETFDPLTGEVFEDGPRRSLAHILENGQQVLCAGRITVYAPRGAYQLVVELAQDAGLGALHAAFEKLKMRLAARGFFARERKRSLPFNPSRVAVVTAPTGAAIRDFLRLAAERGCGAHIRIYPALVQGASAAADIVNAMQIAQSEDWAQVLALIRGGGSLEDLWAFNEEAVAEAVFTARIPVIAGVGHEVDISMADMTADVRAATPSHAAQLLWPARGELTQRVDDVETALRHAAQGGLERHAARLAAADQALGWLSPLRALQRLEERLFFLEERLQRASRQMPERCDVSLRQWENRCAAVFGGEWSGGRETQLRLLATRLERVMEIAVQERETCLSVREQRLRYEGERRIDGARRNLDNLSVRLAGLDPLKPLDRGYALLRGISGEIVRSIRQTPPGTLLDVTLRDGRLAAAVTGIVEEIDHVPES